MGLRSQTFVWVVAAVAAWLYLPLFGGFWLGDDGSNLHRAYALAQQHRLFADTVQGFVTPPALGGSFYRPLMIASIAANYAIAGTHYGGWFAPSIAVHVANIILVAAVVLRFGERLGCDARASAIAAALLFGLTPATSEAVYWVSARSDGWIVLLSLLALHTWASARPTSVGTAIALPLLLFLALGFKESAALLPLQMILIAWAWPTPMSRPQKAAIGAAFALVAAWFALRASLFGGVWRIYGGGPSGDVNGALFTLSEALRSVPGWWRSLVAPHEALGLLYLVALAIAAVGALFSCRDRRAKLAFALAAAGFGLLLATLLNIGLGMSGEGGRHFYAPSAWFALAVGVALSRPQTDVNPSPRRVAWAGCAAAAFAAMLLLHFKVEQVLAAQQHLRALAAAIDSWAASHPGLTMIIAPEMEGSIVTLRNAQGAFALPPIQHRPLLHRALLTVPREVGARHAQFASGLVNLLEANPPAYVDAAVAAAFERHDAPKWPHAACWSAVEQRLVALPDADPANAQTWAQSLLASSQRCFAVAALHR